MRRTSRWISITLASLLVGCLLGAAVAGVLFYSRGVVKYLSSGESSYQAGIAAVRESRFQPAMVYFHEAILSAENLLKEFEGNAQEQAAPQEQMEKDQRMIGQAYWLKHRALKARGFTKMLAENKPLPTFEGQAEGTSDIILQKLSPLRLPEDETRRDAMVCLREAAYRLPGSAEVLREAVATEIQIEPMQWNHVHAFAITLAEVDPADERAQYLIARLEYEQPVAVKADGSNVTMPMPAAKRSRERMLKGLDVVTKLKEKEQPTRWRTLYLEAQINAWLIQYYRQPTQLQPEAERTYLNQLRAILFDADKGVLNRILKEDKLSAASRLDVQGLFGLHQMAIELAIDDSRHADRNTSPDAKHPWAEQVQKLMDAAVMLAKKTKAPGRMMEAADFLTQACLKTMPYLAASRPEVWATYRDQAIDLASAARLENRISSALVVRVADLLIRESQWQDQQGAKEAAAARTTQAMEWLDVGLKKETPDQKQTPASLLLHEAKLRLLVKQSQPLTTLQPHLAVLRQSKQDGSLAAAAYYEGVVLQREGRLQQSRTLLEQAAHSSRNDLNRRAKTLLIPLYLTLELPEQALSTLNELNRLLTRLDAMSADERAWFYSMIRSPDDLLCDRVQAHLQAAQHAQMDLQYANNPAKDLKPNLLRHEQEVRQLVEKGCSNQQIASRMRLAWAQYLLQWDRFDEAQPHLQVLKRDQSDWLETLQLEIGYLLGKSQSGEKGTDASAAPSPLVVQQVDQLIQAYLKKQLANPAAKLVWMKWLSTTGRTDEVKKLLDDAVFLGDATKDTNARRLRAMALLYVGNREQSHALLKALPSDPQVDVALLQTAHTITDQQNVLASAMQHNQDTGLFRTWSAAMSLAKGDHADACRGFVNCLEYSRVRPLARQGLTDALIAWCQYQPAEARKFAAEALQQYPSESSLLLGYAVASMQMGELGSPADTGDQIKDMATALRAFEAACHLERRDPAIAPWVQTQCWLLTPRRDIARMMAVHTVETAPKHEKAYILAIQLLMEQNTPPALEQANALAAAYRKNLPQSVESLYWQAKCFALLGKPNDALTLYRQVMEQAPRHSGVYAATCQLLLNQPNTETLAACQQVLSRWRVAMPEDPVCAQLEVQYAVKAGKGTETRQVVDRYLAVLDAKAQNNGPIQTVSTEKPQNMARLKADALCLIAQGLIKEQQYAEAQTWLQRAMELVSSYEPAQLLMGSLLLEQMKKQTPSSESRKALAQQAVAVYSVVYRKHPSQALAGNNLAWLLSTELNDPNEAYRIMLEVRSCKHYTRPMTGDLLSPEMLDTLSQIYRRLNRPDLAPERVELFEAARRRYVDDPRVAVSLAQGYLAAGDQRRAMQTFQSARTLLPKSTLSAEAQRTVNQEIQTGINESQSIK